MFQLFPLARTVRPHWLILVALSGCSQKSLPGPGDEAAPSTTPDAAASSTGDASPEASSGPHPDASAAPTSDNTDASPPSETDASSGDAATPMSDAGDDDAAAQADAAPSTSDSSQPPPLESYFPMGDGVRFTFRHTSPSKGTWLEETTVTEIEWQGDPAWKVEGSPDVDGYVDIQIWQDQAGTIGRVHRELYLGDALEETVDYDPGFARFSPEWETPDFTETISYTRATTDDMGVVTTDTRDHVFTTLDTDATVTVDNTVYKHCLQVERHRDDNMETKQFWFARGVGKIKELDPDNGAVEELVEVLDLN